MTTIQNILERATQLARETAIGSINPHRIGSIMVDTLQNLNEYQLTAGSLALQKIYDSINAMEADNAPVSDLSGRMLKLGQLVVISSNDDDSGKVYRYDGIVDNKSTWSFVYKIAQLPEHEKRLTIAEQDIRILSSNKADKTGRYPDMSVGFADNLVGRGESTPAEFSFRASGGKSIKDGTARIKRLRGNSVVWNQHLSIKTKLTYANAAGSSYYSLLGLLPYYNTAINGRRIFAIAKDSKNQLKSIYFNDTLQRDLRGGYIFTANTTMSDKTSVFAEIEAGIAVNTDVEVFFYDLTQMFGAGNEPQTIDDFYSRIPQGIDMDAYNEGEVIHMNTESIMSVGDNAWDEQWEIGVVDDNGEEQGWSDNIRSKNYIHVLPGSQYMMPYAIVSYGPDQDHYFYVVFFDQNKTPIGTWRTYGNWGEDSWKVTIPSDCHYIRFFTNFEGEKYKGDIMISLVHSGWKQDTDAGYQEYWQDTLPLPIIRKYFPDGMKSAGSAHDEIRYNKATQKWEAVKRIGEVDMGELTYYKSSVAESAFYTTDLQLIGRKESKNILSAKFLSGSDVANNGVMSNDVNGTIYFNLAPYTDVASFKAAMQGVILYYELANPIVTEIYEDINLDYRVADFGTEEAISSQPSAPFRADIIYQFNAVDMIREHELEIAELQSIIATMQAQLVSLTSQSEDIK